MGEFTVKMAPGQEPYTEDELRRVYGLVAAASRDDPGEVGEIEAGQPAFLPGHDVAAKNWVRVFDFVGCHDAAVALATATAAYADEGEAIGADRLFTFAFPDGVRVSVAPACLDCGAALEGMDWGGRFYGDWYGCPCRS